EAVKKIKEVSHVSVNITAQARKPQGSERRILTNVKNIIAVASGKGGVGKSTTAVNLAVALAESGKRVGILDADIYGPSVPTMMRIEVPPEPRPNNRIAPAKSFGVEVISMAFFMPKERAAILRGPMVSGYVTQFLANVEWGELDDLVIDYPPGTGDIQLTLSQQAPITGAVITTTPQEISLVDVRRAIAMFETTRVPVLGVCETMSYFVCDQCNKKHYIFRSGGGERMAHQAGVPFLGGIPIDPRVTEGGDAGTPIVKSHPGSPAAEAYKELARAVEEQLALLNQERGNYLESFSLDWA
ncbi:Mrp/NBP35 family ATP-binding protein, partial [Candidatus Sumerlaeota bacterium]|nr:Mrp/NBP35 family ATP-binding protein [Candidatus Sumerlaeota bacterium]